MKIKRGNYSNGTGKSTMITTESELRKLVKQRLDQRN